MSKKVIDHPLYARAKAKAKKIIDLLEVFNTMEQPEKNGVYIPDGDGGLEFLELDEFLEKYDPNHSSNDDSKTE